MDAQRPRSKLWRSISSGPILQPDETLGLSANPTIEGPTRPVKLRRTAPEAWISTKTDEPESKTQSTSSIPRTVQQTSMGDNANSVAPETVQQTSQNDSLDAMPLPTSTATSTTTINEMQLEIADLRRRVDANATGIARNQRAIQKQKLDGEVAGMVGKFRILGYIWKLSDFKARAPANTAASGAIAPPPTTARRKFIKMLMRVAFVNQGLIDNSQNVDTLVSDCYPAMGAWYDDGALEVVFSDMVLWHAVKEKLSGRALLIKVRVALPRILHCMYDDALRYRRTLLDVVPTRTLYIDVRRQDPYVTLVEKN